MRKSGLLYVAIIAHLLLLLQCASSFAKEPRFTTNPRRTDGFGAQFQTIIYSIIFAEFHHRTYLYTPIQAMDHNYEEDPNFLERMESLINLRDYCPINTNLRLQKDNAKQLIKFFESNLSACVNSQALETVKTLFRLNKKSEFFFNNSRLQYNIVIHVRRHNPHDTRTLGTDTLDSFYLSLINRLRMEYQDKNPLFHIFSQGEEEAFRSIYTDSDIVLHINSSIEEAFTSMVLADVLVIAPSSFSYTAGILSDGIVYYVPFWHPPLPGWIVIDNGSSQESGKKKRRA